MLRLVIAIAIAASFVIGLQLIGEQPSTDRAGPAPASRAAEAGATARSLPTVRRGEQRDDGIEPARGEQRGDDGIEPARGAIAQDLTDRRGAERLVPNPAAAGDSARAEARVEATTGPMTKAERVALQSKLAHTKPARELVPGLTKVRETLCTGPDAQRRYASATERDRMLERCGPAPDGQRLAPRAAPDGDPPSRAPAR
ncbi:MAG: hypothetical protein H0T89_00295 [Deltaproteobacteria bacterium]|nr:hypothetical protein [Deltaproteobacteria bacterium]MDQ3295243.1 hypothetical protein [Myxococcota bacterium]